MLSDRSLIVLDNHCYLQAIARNNQHYRSSLKIYIAGFALVFLDRGSVRKRSPLLALLNCSVFICPILAIAYTGKDGEKVRLAKGTEQCNGNLAYLSSIQWCIDRCCKLLGLDAPIKAQINAQLGVGELEFKPEKMTTEELQAIANSSLKPNTTPLALLGAFPKSLHRSISYIAILIDLSSYGIFVLKV